MKRSIKSLIGYPLSATDGEIGKIKEFYFEDGTWTIRYLIVETGNWFFDRKVLISPQALLTPEWNEKNLPVNLTREQIKCGPHLDTQKTVSRQEEIEYRKLHPWNTYTEGAFFGGAFPIYNDTDLHKGNDYIPGEKPDNKPLLRSSAEVALYNVKETDGERGFVDDFLFDENTWKIKYLVIDTGKWITGKKVLITTKMITEINSSTSSIIVKATVEQVKGSPIYDSNLLLN